MIPVRGDIKQKEEPIMQNNPHKQDVIQELRGKRRDIPGLYEEANVSDERRCYGLSLSECA